MVDAYLWDVFVSHASEDKPLVEPLAEELRRYGLRVWLDCLVLNVGDSLRSSIDQGLSKSRFGVVVLSPAFFVKPWPQSELNGLFAREIEGRPVILPVWHGVTKADVLQYSPMLADKVALNSALPVADLARRLIAVLRPEALQIPTSVQDAAMSTDRLRSQLKEREPRFDYRIATDSEPSTTTRERLLDPNARLIMSSRHDGLRIDIIAPDAAAYEQNPVSVNLELSQEAALRMQQAISTGETVSFGPAEIGKVESDFFQLLGMPNTLTSLTVGPPADLLAKRLRLRVTFAANGETQEFPLVEFKPRRSGADEIELESCSPPLPVQLRITLPVKSGGGRLNLAYEYAGHDIRKVHKAHRALHLMHHGGTITLFDLDEDAHTGTMHLSIPGDAFSSPELDKFLDDLLEIARALKTTIIWNRPTFKDAANAAAVRHIIHTGSHLVPARCLTMNLTLAQLTIAEEALSRGEGLRFTSQAAPDVATILGQQLDLGECELLIRANELRRCHAADTGSVSVELTVTEPPCYRFLRFVPNQPDNVK